MSYDIRLLGENGKPVPVRPFMGGGTIMVNPETMDEIPQVQADLNITYNYSRVYALAIKAALWDLQSKGSDVDIYGRYWNDLPREEACSTCGQPDNCGDCNHEPLAPDEVVELGGTTRDLTRALWGMNEDGLVRHLDGKVAACVRDALETVLAQLANDRPYGKDYWAPTIGNAAGPLQVLVSWCHEHPNGTFDVT